MKNHVEIEVGFIHFTSRKGDFPVTFLGACDDEQFTVSVPKERWDAILDDGNIPNFKNGTLFVCGRLSKVGSKVVIEASEGLSFHKN